MFCGFGQRGFLPGRGVRFCGRPIVSGGFGRLGFNDVWNAVFFSKLSRICAGKAVNGKFRTVCKCYNSCGMSLNIGYGRRNVNVFQVAATRKRVPADIGQSVRQDDFCKRAASGKGESVNIIYALWDNYIFK